MVKVFKSFSVAILLALTLGSLPAVAATTSIWSTTSKSEWVEAVGQPQIVTSKDGEKTAAVWLVRTSQQTSKLFARIKSAGVWSKTELVADFPWDWYVAFNAQVTDSGRVVIGVSDSDYPLKAYERVDANSWTSTIVDNDSRGTLTAFEVGGTVAGEVVTFTNNVQVSERQAILKSWSIDKSVENAQWTSHIVRDVSRTSGEFAACNYNKKYWSSCSIRLETPQILTMADGAQVLLVSASRSSSTYALPGTQFKTFMAQRVDASSDWVWKGGFLTQTMASKDEAYAYFTFPAVVAADDKWAIAVTTGSSTTKYNTVKLFTGKGVGSLPKASDASNLAKRKGTENPILLADGTSIKMAFENNGKTFFGTVGSLSSASRMANVSSGQSVKSLVKHNGSISAIIQTHATATYISRLNGKTWSSQTKLMSYADPSWVSSINATVNRGNVIVISPKNSKKRNIALYMTEYSIKP